MGEPGGLNEGVDLMSRTPKCDMFLKTCCADQTKNVGKIKKKSRIVGNVGKVGIVEKVGKVLKIEKFG